MVPSLIVKPEGIPYFQEVVKRGEERGFAIGEKRGFAIGLKRGFAIGEKRGFAIGLKRGFAIGLKRGFAIGQIKLLQELRGLPVDSDETLRNLSPETLQAKLDELKSRGIAIGIQ